MKDHWFIVYAIRRMANLHKRICRIEEGDGNRPSMVSVAEHGDRLARLEATVRDLKAQAHEHDTVVRPSAAKVKR